VSGRFGKRAEETETEPVTVGLSGVAQACWTASPALIEETRSAEASAPETAQALSLKVVETLVDGPPQTMQPAGHLSTTKPSVIL
jgi:hypothetical protein